MALDGYLLSSQIGLRPTMAGGQWELNFSEYIISPTTSINNSNQTLGNCKMFSRKKKKEEKWLMVIRTAADVLLQLRSYMIKLYVMAQRMNKIRSIRDAEHPACINISQPTFPPAFVCLFFFLYRVEYCAIIVFGILADAFLISQHRFLQLFQDGG